MKFQSRINGFVSLTKGLLIAAFAVALGGCAVNQSTGGWATLLDGEKGMENFNRLGDANWRAEGGLIVADKGKGGFLVTVRSQHLGYTP